MRSVDFVVRDNTYTGNTYCPGYTPNTLSETSSALPGFQKSAGSVCLMRFSAQRTNDLVFALNPVSQAFAQVGKVDCKKLHAVVEGH